MTENEETKEGGFTAERVTKKHAARAKIKALYESAFPAKERVNIGWLNIAAKRKGIDFTAYYDGGEFCGFTYSCETPEILFVFFLAVESAARGRGYGTKILSYLKERAGERPVALNVEPPDPAAPNNAERLRRIEFYRKNGFCPTGYSMREVGGKFNVLSTRSGLDPKSCKRVFRRVSFGLYRISIKKS